MSFVFFATFPLWRSAFGFRVDKTKQLLFALLEEFLQTLLIMLFVGDLVLGDLLYVWPWFVGLFTSQRVRI